MPICPSCHTSFHEGAQEACPACRYSLLDAEEIFGARNFSFERVNDVAGALKVAEMESLERCLQKLENRLRPITLGVVLVSECSSKTFRPYAHWVINHAQPSQRAFGRRKTEQGLAARSWNEPMQEVPRSPFMQRMSRVVRCVKQRFFPEPPPVSNDRMLVLVMDVLLGQACFSWE